MASAGAFRKLAPAEQERILSACLAEFAARGYAGASTNAIVKRLGIPKGSIFYWFGSRDGLYLHLVERATARFVRALEDRVQAWPTEILARLRVITEASLEFLASEPDQYRLFTSFMDGEAVHLRDQFLRTRMPDGLATWARWFEGVDGEDFRAPPDDVRGMLSWVIAGVKLESFSRLGSAGTPEDLRTLLLERLDGRSPCSHSAIYRHPPDHGYS